MIQELLGDAGLLVGGRKISFSHGVLDGSSPSSSPSPSAAVATSTINTTTSTAALLSSSENLRCPRCDSSNTKFCYYNNYNLTQPRHFCKTCRRYWTKGGALRNIPIGGGCRKNKSTIATTINVTNSSSAGKSTAGKAKTASSSSSEIIKSLGSGLLSHHHQDSTVLWGSPQNSQLLALLRATQNNPNPNPNMLNSINIKDEGPLIGSHVNTESAVLGTGGLSARTLGLDPLGQVPNIGFFSSFWRNNQHQLIQQHQNQLHHQPQQSGLLLGEIQNAGVQELSQRVRSSSSNHYSTTDHLSQGFALTSNVPSSILEVSSGSGGELGYWNPTFSWSDLPTSNASFP